MEPPEYATAADAETRGLHAALTRACALEARLRSAVQASHPISSSLELDPSSADREREALLATWAFDQLRSILSFSRFEH